MRASRLVALAALGFLAGCGSDATITAPGVDIDTEAEALSTELAAGFFAGGGAVGGVAGMPMEGMGGMGPGGIMVLGPILPSSPASAAGGSVTIFGMPGMDANAKVTYYDAAGAVQQEFDSLTTARIVVDETVKLRVTMTMNGSTRVLTMEGTNHAELSGLAGQETSTTLDTRGTSKVVSELSASGRPKVTTTVNATHEAKGLVLPVRRAPDAFRPAPPVAGTTTSESTITAVAEGGASKTIQTKVVTTFDASGTATIVVTTNGTTRTCTQSLADWHLTCR